VKGYPDQTVIRQSDYQNLYGKPIQVSKQIHNNFTMMPKRGEFIKNCKSIDPHQERFNMNENYDRSTYLTKVRRVQGREFGSYSNRISDNLIK